jgi:hypothetical protein
MKVHPVFVTRSAGVDPSPGTGWELGLAHVGCLLARAWHVERELAGVLGRESRIDQPVVRFDSGALNAVVRLMSSPEFDQAQWERLIRAVRGNRLARVWYLYKTGRLPSAEGDQGHLSDTYKPELRAPDGADPVGIPRPSTLVNDS